VLALGLGFSLARRELILPAAVAACGIVYLHSKGTQSVYVTAKALVIAGPVVAVTGIRGLLSTPLRPPPRTLALARAAAAIAFVFFAAKSTYEVLRDEPTWPPTSTGELVALAHVTRGSSVLFLGASDYADWMFSNSNMSTLSTTSVSMAQAAPRPGKPNTYGTAFDFDSVDPASINRFTWIITTRTSYASQPPPGLQLVRSLPLYELWRRTGTIPSRQVIEGAGAPGAVLNCRTRFGRALSRRHGMAAVMATPAIASLGALAPGYSERFQLHLPAGRWEISLQYESAVDLRIVTPGHNWVMPAYLDRPGPVFDVGSLTSTGAPTGFTLYADKPTSFTGPNLVAEMLVAFATRLPDTRTLVPLSQACGRYVDWYRLSA
jgi:hypothetical protein